MAARLAIYPLPVLDQFKVGAAPGQRSSMIAKWPVKRVQDLMNDH